MIQTLDTLVNPFGDLKSGSPDNINKLDFQKDELVELALKKYFTIRSWKDTTDWTSEHLSGNYLKPSQITNLTQIILAIPESKRPNNLTTGYFFSNLMLLALAKGHRDFKLCMHDSNLNYLCEKLHDSNISVAGSVGQRFGMDSVNTQFDLHGNATQVLGYSAKNCKFNVTGSVGIGCGNTSRGSQYIISGDADESIGAHSRDCLFVVEGNTGKYCGQVANNSEFVLMGRVEAFKDPLLKRHGSKNCTFKLADRESYERLKMHIYRRTGNKIEYIGK